MLQRSIHARASVLYCIIVGSCTDDEMDDVGINSNRLSSNGNILDPAHIDLSLLHITAVQTLDTASVYLKQSPDNTIRFIPFRKPRDSWCSKQDYYFETDCVNVHNVRSMSFNNNELSFILSGSYPRLIEVTPQTEIILNDRIFEVETYYNEVTNKEETKLTEILSSNMYQNGENNCIENIQIEKLKNNNDKLIIDGSCYGLLYLPANTIFFQEKSFQLLASHWSSIVIDSNVYTPEIIIAANDFASIIFRSSLTALDLKLAITHESYVEFKKIRESTHVSLVAHEGSQIYVPEMIDVERADVAARNR